VIDLRFGARLWFAAGVLLATASLVNCSSGSSTVPPSIVISPSPSPAATAQTASGTVSVPTTASTVPLPSVAGGQLASLAIGAGAPAGVTINATVSNVAPSSAVAPSSIKRSAQSLADAVPFFWVTFTVSGSLPASFFAGESITLGAADPTTASYYAEYDDITSPPATKIVSYGPGTLSAGTVTITNTGVSASSFVSGHTYLLQFYYIPAGDATPSPAPSASPSPTPSASPSPTPSASPSPTPTPTPVPTTTPLPAFTFSGSTATDNSSQCNPTAACQMLYLSPGGLFSFSAPSAATTLTATAASGASQISPSSSFPYLTGMGTVIEYVQLSASPAVSFLGSPQIMLNGAVNGETSCSFYGYENLGAGYAWTFIAGPASTNGSSVTIPGVELAGATFGLSPTPFYGAVACTP
jgi:hypothetical protein